MEAIDQAPFNFESSFRERLDGVQMAPGYLRLFREIVLDVWKAEQAQAVNAVAALDARVTQAQRRLERLEEVFIYEQAIDPGHLRGAAWQGCERN